jgi:hypothetical protein
MTNVSHKSCRGNQNTHFMSNNVFPENRAVYNVEKYVRARQATDDNIIRRMRFACWITKATDTHSECVILIAFPQHKWLRERASVLQLYVHCLYCLLFLQFLLSALFTSRPLGVCASSLPFCLTSVTCLSSRQQFYRSAGQHFSIPRYALPQGKQHYLKLKVVSFTNSTRNERVEFTSAAAGGGICCYSVHLAGTRESGRQRDDQKILANGVGVQNIN